MPVHGCWSQEDNQGWHGRERGGLDVGGGGGGIFNDTMKPSHKFVAEWLVDVYASILAQTVRNVWMKKGFEWHKIIQYLISCL